MTRANDCVPSMHIHVGVCARAGYANGRADVIDEIEGVGTVTEWGIEWYEKAKGYPDVSGPFDERITAEYCLSRSVFGGRVVRRSVTTSEWARP
jgi:hypothetical protein